MSRYQRLERRTVTDLEREIEAESMKYDTVELNIEFMKFGPYLGFDLGVSRNPITNKEYIYICQIFDFTSAKMDGQLRVGDKILSVNGSDITFYNKPEVVELLRSIKIGENLNITVQRSIGVEKKSRKNHQVAKSFKLSRPIYYESDDNSDDAEEAVNSDRNCDRKDMVDNNRRIRKESTFHVSPLMKNDIFGMDKSKTKCGSYHFNVPFNLRDGFESILGFNMKNDKDTDTNRVQIYISSILKGGATWRDGRLLPGDKIIALQGIDLETGKKYDPDEINSKGRINLNFLKELNLKIKSEEGLQGDPYNHDLYDLLYAKINQLKKTKELNEIVGYAEKRPLLFAKLFINEVSQMFDSLSIVVRREEPELNEEEKEIMESLDTVKYESPGTRRRKTSTKQKILNFPRKIYASFRRSKNVRDPEELEETIDKYRRNRHKDSISLDETYFQYKPLSQKRQIIPKLSTSTIPQEDLYTPLSPNHFHRLTSNYVFYNELRNKRDKPRDRKLRHSNSMFSI